MTRRAPAYQVLLVLLLSVNFGILFFDRNALNFLMPFVQPELKLTFTQVGLLSSALSLTWAGSGILIGRWSDRVGRKKVFIVAAGVVFSLCSFLSGIAASFLTLLYARLVMGAAEGAVLPISHSLAAAEVAPERRGLAMGVVQNLGSCFLGAFLAPVLLPIFASMFGWRHAFFIAGAPGLLLALLILLFVQDPLPPESNAHREHLTLAQAFQHKNMILCVLIAILMVSYLVITLTFMPLYLTRMSKLPPQTAGWLMGVLGISATIGSFVIPAISDWIGRRPVMIAVPFISLLLPLGVLYLAPSVRILAPVFFVGWAMNGIFPMFMATIPSETLPPKYVATAAGIVMGLGEIIGGVCSPFFAGWASDRAGLNVVLWILAGLTLTAGLLAFFLDETAPRKRQQSNYA
jgi:ACS family hexuronate transporter-like MFS transporter